MGLERLDGEAASFERLQEVLQSLPFLADKKMVVLTAPSANKQFMEQAERLLTELPQTTEAVIVEPKLDKRLAYYKLLKKQKNFREFLPLDEAMLIKWVCGEAKRRGASISSSDARYLVERVGTDPRLLVRTGGQSGLGGRVGTNEQLLASELEKLAIHNARITRASIDLLTEPAAQSTVFELLEAAFVGDHKKALELYHEQRIMKVEPQQVIAMLAWQLHILALIKAAGQRSPEDIAREAKISPFVVRKSAVIARHLTVAQTRRLIADLLTIDMRLKRESLNADDALQHYLMTLQM